MALYQNGTLVSGSGNIPELTLAQYNALSVKPTYWVRTDLDYNDIDAQNVAYDNTGSGLSATKVQGAIDEVNGNVTNKKNSADFATVVSSATSTANTTEYLSYPTGFNYSNTYIISCFITDGATRWIGGSFAECATGINTIDVTPKLDGYYVGVLLMKS